MIPLNPSTTMVQTSRGPIKAIHIKVPVGIPTPDGGLEIPNRVFLGGIPNETTELELETFFCDYGMVKDVRIVTDRITGESKGFGFVTFDENEDISKLLNSVTIVMKGKKLRVRKAIRRNSSQFVNNDNTSSSSPDSSTSSSGSGPSSTPNSNSSNQGFTEPVLLLHGSQEQPWNVQQGSFPYNYPTTQLQPGSGYFKPMPPTSIQPQQYPTHSQYQHSSGQQIPPHGQQLAHQNTYPGMQYYHGQFPQQSLHPAYFIPFNPAFHHNSNYGYQMY